MSGSCEPSVTSPPTSRSRRSPSSVTRQSRRGKHPARGTLFRAILWAFLGLVAALMLLRVARAPDPSTADGERTAIAQLAYLGDGDLEARADRMQEVFPEGRVFTLALYGLAWVDVGRGTA